MFICLDWVSIKGIRTYTTRDISLVLIHCACDHVFYFSYESKIVPSPNQLFECVFL